MSLARRMFAAARFEWHIAKGQRLLDRARARHERDEMAGALIDKARTHLERSDELRESLARKKAVGW